ncbi:MarR family winged helix-turn-helix transcriptional regulator [Lacrimispora sp.]|jgi:DNA-binding MarR family transcriptional regulator|uniref:MarR family winged helix-turn-helix transcriptional regulator n=1 Tax=Lacrimispora sp. TaxID=2719234 RepID=UPI0028AE1C33|nr:MarR family winged helix-turn-helix transcriptional regulator [Lacrimispora sp.]
MNETIGKLTAAINRNLQIILNHKLKDISIRSGQHDFFYVISLYEGITQKELSEWLYISKSTTAKAVKNLMDHGYVRKEKDTEDNRYDRLYLTEKGKQISAQMQETFKEVVDITTRNLSPLEIKQTKELLKRILNNVLEENRTED